MDQVVMLLWPIVLMPNEIDFRWGSSRDSFNLWTIYGYLRRHHDFTIFTHCREWNSFGTHQTHSNSKQRRLWFLFEVKRNNRIKIIMTRNYVIDTIVCKNNETLRFWWSISRVCPPPPLPISNVQNILLDNPLPLNRFNNIARGGGGH